MTQVPSVPSRPPRSARIPFLIFAAACLVILGCVGQRRVPLAGLAAPQQRDDGWRTAALSEVGIDPVPIQAMVDRVKDGTFPSVHGILIARNGKLVYEKYFPGYAWDYKAEGFRGPWTEYGPDTPHNLASVTKSVTGTLLAIAMDSGYVKSLDEPLCSFFPEHAQLCDGGKERITLRQVLMMASGLEWNEQDVPYADPRNDIVQLFLVPDPIQYILSKPLTHEPGTRWYYNGGGTNLLGKVIERASGMTLDEFAQRHLFAPLRITGQEWVRIQPDFVYASGDLKMRPRDMAKLGQLLLDHGAWNGESLLSPEKADALTQKYVSFTQTSGYSYHWWLRTYAVGSKPLASFYADGWGGQRIMGFPELRLVVVFTAGSYTEDPRLDEIVTRFILPAVTAPPACDRVGANASLTTPGPFSEIHAVLASERPSDEHRGFAGPLHHHPMQQERSSPRGGTVGLSSRRSPCFPGPGRVQPHFQALERQQPPRSAQLCEHWFRALAWRCCRRFGSP